MVLKASFLIHNEFMLSTYFKSPCNYGAVERCIGLSPFNVHFVASPELIYIIDELVYYIS